MSYIDKARELGEALVQTPEVQALIAAEAAIKADAEANESFMQYQEKERQLITAQMLSKVVPEKESLALIDLKIRIMNKHPLIKTYCPTLSIGASAVGSPQIRNRGTLGSIYRVLLPPLIVLLHC